MGRYKFSILIVWQLAFGVTYDCNYQGMVVYLPFIIIYYSWAKDASGVHFESQLKWRNET